MLKICLDAHNLSLPSGTGIATYTRSLLANLKASGAETHVLYGPPQPAGRDALDAELSLFARPPKLTRMVRVNRWFEKYRHKSDHFARPVPKTGQVIWPPTAGGEFIDRPWAATDLFRRASRLYQTQGSMSEVCFGHDRAAPDVMHWTSVLPVMCADRPNLYTIHDLIPLKLPHVSVGDKRALYSLCKDIARRADRIVTVSENARHDIIDLLGVDPGKVVNTYQSIDPEFVTSQTEAGLQILLQDQYGLEFKQYFLYYGTIEPKKNVARLLEAYIRSGVTSPLVIAGQNGWLDEQERSLLAQIERDEGALSKRVHRYEYLPKSMLSDLVAGARATVFPSIYEGFGLPVLESMASGTAVITSSGGALEEIAGGAALLVDPYDIASIQLAFQTLQNDPDLVRQLETVGRVRAGHFSPQRYTERLSGLYSDLV